MKGLWVSTKGAWAGDVDLNDGKLQEQKQKFLDRIHWVEGIGLSDRSSLQQIDLDLKSALKFLDEDLKFIHSGKLMVDCVRCTCVMPSFFIELQKANSSYEEKLQEGCSKDKTLFSLSWDIEELKAMNEEGRRMRIEISSLLNLSPTSFQSVNGPRKLTAIRQQFCDLTRRVVKFKREAATHVFVFYDQL